MRYAIVENDLVTNIILWNGVESYTPSGECEVCEVSDEVSIGWSRQGEQWIAPEPVEVEIPSEDSTVRAAKEAALLELITLGISEDTARTIIGLPSV